MFRKITSLRDIRSCYSILVSLESRFQRFLIVIAVGGEKVVSTNNTVPVVSPPDHIYLYDYAGKKFGDNEPPQNIKVLSR